MTTETEDFWRGQFGNDYHQRSPGNVLSNRDMFERALGAASMDLDTVPTDLDTVLEFGAGRGNNLRALRELGVGTSWRGIEINPGAARELCREFPGSLIGSFLDPVTTGSFSPADLTMTKGVLIHVPPDDLPRAYGVLHRLSKRWILIAEYYNPTPVEVPYRGHAGRLWKRDFAGDMLTAFPDLTLVDYGFVYHRDEYPQDDLTWFLMEKKSR